MEAKSTSFTLDELDQLEPGLGSEILKKIDSVGSIFQIEPIRTEIKALLQNVGLSTSDIASPADYIGNNLDELFSGMAGNFQFMDQCDM